MTKSEKRREVTNTGGGGLRVRKPLPAMCSECKEIVFYKDKYARWDNSLHTSVFEPNSSVFFGKKIEYRSS